LDSGPEWIQEGFLMGSGRVIISAIARGDGVTRRNGEEEIHCMAAATPKMQWSQSN
jgi:hypothetical protein